MKWGVFDIKDRCWIGNEEGPLLYKERLLAKFAANVMMYRMRNYRYRARRYRPGPLVLKDEITPTRTAEQAIRQIELNTGWRVVGPEDYES